MAKATKGRSAPDLVDIVRRELPNAALMVAAEDRIAEVAGGEVAALKHFVADLQRDSQAKDEAIGRLTERLAFFEQHGTALKPDPIAGKPNGKLTSRLDASFHSRLPQLAAHLRMIVSDRYVSWAVGDNFSQSGWMFKVSEFPRSVAAELVGLTGAKEDLEGKQRAELLTGRDNKAAIERLRVEVAAREQHVDLLLAAANLPELPQVLQEQLLPRTAEQERIAHNTAVFNRDRDTAAGKAPQKPDSSAAPVVPPPTPKPAGGATAAEKPSPKDKWAGRVKGKGVGKLGSRAAWRSQQ